jgi:pilus assembly protein FimV
MRRPIIQGLTARLMLGAVLGFSPVAGYSLGLGKLKVTSGLNEPLKAEIDFTSIADNERRGLNVSLAPRADFDAAGAERVPFLSQIKFQIVQRADGRYFLELKTEQPVEEPFLHMLLQLEWPGGRLVREYTALVDPPSYMISKPATVEVPNTAPSTEAAAPAPSNFVQTVPPPTPEPAPTVAQASPPASTPEAPPRASEPALSAAIPDKVAEPMLRQ